MASRTQRLREAIFGENKANPVERSLREQLNMADVTVENLRENLSRLEQGVESGEWRRIAFQTMREFTRPGLDDVSELSRAMYLSNPLIQRAVNVTTYYVWGQGATFKAEEEQIQKEVVEPQMEDDGNRAELYSHQARLLTEVDQMIDGNVFLALFTDPMGQVSIRSIPVNEIRNIHHKPGDRQQIWYYRRIWTEEEFDVKTGRIQEKERECLYPDWRYQPVVKPNSIGGVEVLWDAPVIHRKTGGLKHMMFGFPETYAAIDWARAYKKFLEDWHTLVASLARFAWQATTKGKNIPKAKAKLQSTEQTEGRERNPRGPAGQVAFVPEGDELTPIPKTGANTSAEDAKPSRLMVASTFDLPDTILSSDPQQGALATAKTLDRPTELGFRNRQISNAELHQDIFRYSVDARVRRGRLPGRVETLPSGLTVVEPTLSPKVTVTFPPILEHDVLALVQSIVAAATLEGKAEAGTIPREETSKLLMEAIGIEDIEGALEELGEEGTEQLAEAINRLSESLKR